MFAARTEKMFVVCLFVLLFGQQSAAGLVSLGCGPVTVNSGFSGGKTSVSLSEDASVLAIAVEQEGVYVGKVVGSWNADTYSPLSNPDDEHKDHYGASVAVSLSGNRLVVGAPGDSNSGKKTNGAAYLYDLGTGALVSTAHPDDKVVDGDGDHRDWFGRAVAIGNGYVYVGGEIADANGKDSGVVHFYDYSGAEQVPELTPGTKGDRCGNAIAPDHSVGSDPDVLVACYNENDVPIGGYGIGYLYDSTAFVMDPTKLYSANGAGRQLGFCADLDGGYAVLGSPNTNYDNVADSGTAYIFKKDGTWDSESTYELAADPTLGEKSGFGMACAITNDGVGVGVIAAVAAESTIFLFNAQSGCQIGVLEPGNSVESLSFAGKYLAAGLANGQAVVYDLSTNCDLACDTLFAHSVNSTRSGV